MSRVAVVVPARDAAATLAACLDALAAQTRPADAVVVVDNGSTDATGRIAAAHAVVDLVVAGPGRGPGPARNAGVAAVDATRVAFTDADCVPAADWLARLLAAPGDVVQGRVEPDPAAARTPWERTLAVPAFTGLFETANLLVDRAAFDAVGGFPDGIEAQGDAPFGEDALLGWALVAAGADPAFAPDALVHHAVTPRDQAAFVAERRRLALFPPLVAAAPPVRDTFLRHRLFLTDHTAAFDLALAGAVLAVVGAAAAVAPRRGTSADLARAGLGAPLVGAAGLAATLPYARRVRRLVRHWPQHPSTAIAATHLRADATGLVALLRGSARAGTPVL